MVTATFSPCVAVSSPTAFSVFERRTKGRPVEDLTLAEGLPIRVDVAARMTAIWD
jgi:hypothetical protein